jgi:hypothetical protein
MKGACNAMFATFWQRLPHRDYDDLNPRLEHAEAVVQWQWLALWHMWEAVFGFALWHSGDSGVFLGKENVTSRSAKNLSAGWSSWDLPQALPTRHVQLFAKSG